MGKTQRSNIPTEEPIKKKHAGGRPSKYTPELAAKICEAVGTTTQGLKDISKRDDMPAETTIYQWLLAHPEFSKQYYEAKSLQSNLFAEECLEIANNCSNDIIRDEQTGKLILN